MEYCVGWFGVSWNKRGVIPECMVSSFSTSNQILINHIFRVIASIGLFLLHNPSQCKSVEWLVYLSFLIIGNLVTILLCISIAFASARGSILDVNARRAVVKLIYCRVPLFVAEIVYTVISAIFAFGKPIKFHSFILFRSIGVGWMSFTYFVENNRCIGIVLDLLCSNWHRRRL
jgi:hypothetical protein